jgi:NAD(P)-dependent dehydrogenase (short-subunit alcohol dehydrogenase family)
MAFDIDLTGRRALVTGSGQGVGRVIARYLAQAGADVLVNDIVVERADAVASEIRDAGGQASSLAFDVTEWTEVSKAIESSGPLDILVNNAGNAGSAGWSAQVPFVDTELEEWEPFLKVNLYGPMYTVRAALPMMIEQSWGRIITIVSDAGRVGESRMAAYCAAKAGAAGFSRAVAREAGRYGITVNNIALGSMNTPTTSKRSTDDPALKRYVIRRFGEPEDVAGMALYLASSLSSWVTGQTLAVNGGYSFSL